ERAPGLRRGGILNVIRHEIDIACAVDNIPDSVVVDLDGLEIGDSIHVEAVTMPQGVRPALGSCDTTIATVAASSAVREEAVAGGRGGGGGGAPGAGREGGPRPGPPRGGGGGGRRIGRLMRLIVGPGNRGLPYAKNRHNVGFVAVDAIARRHGFPGFRDRFKG